MHGIISLSKLHIFVTQTGKTSPSSATQGSLCRAILAAVAITMAVAGPPAARAQSPDASTAETGTEQTAGSQPVVALFEPPSMRPGREAASVVIGAVAANFWLDGNVDLAPAAEDFFAFRTDPLRAHTNDDFPAFIDMMRDKAVSVPLFARLVEKGDEEPRLGFAWEDENVPPPPSLTFRAALDRQCFTLNIPLHWERLIDAPLALPEEDGPNERGELRLDIVAEPTEVYATPVANDARQVFGVRCQSHTVIKATPIAGVVMTAGGAFLTVIASEFL